MADPEEVTNSSPIATLGESLNYQPAILESLLQKKQRLHSFEELKKNINQSLIPLEDIDDDLSLKVIEKAVKKLTAESEKLDTFVKSIDAELKTGVINDVESDLKGLTTETGTTTGLIATAKAAAEPDKEAEEAKVVTAFKKVTTITTTLGSRRATIDEAIQEEETLALNESEQAADYFLGSLATALFNNILPDDNDERTPLASIREKVSKITSEIDERLYQDLDAIIHAEEFQALEANWVGLNNLIESTDWSADVKIDIIDCTKEELGEDLENNEVDLINGDFFKKVYVAEYDQFGGLPYGAIIGLYEFENTEDDRDWLSTMGKLANASHAPFISSVGPKFFGCKNIDEMAEIKDLAAHMSHPRFEKWQAMRDTEHAAYIGLTLPRFLLRTPYDPENNPAKGLDYKEKINLNKGGEDFLWCNAAFLFAKNMIRSFATSGWCQYIRGPKGGGQIKHLPRYAFDLNGQQEFKSPIEMIIPDYRELAFADAGFIPLIHRKGGSEACFFSSQSIKKPKALKDPRLAENSQLVTNLAYTLSITRIAHYVKCIMRDNIGSAADDAYINNVLQTWLSKYVTTVINPDDLTLRYYPFKAAQVTTTPREGMIGWYNSEITILPHIQFEGLDVELKMDVRI
jgi:type VI secretion system protein ImpC